MEDEFRDFHWLNLLHEPSLFPERLHLKKHVITFSVGGQSQLVRFLTETGSR